MKLFAIITAGLMAAGTGAYFLHSGSDCPLAKSGGCCQATATATPDCCATACPACATDCLTCCDLCESCCTVAVQAPVSEVKAECCAAGASKLGAGAAKVAAVKTDCCAASAEFCEPVSACCGGRTSPASVVNAAVAAGIAAK